MNETKQTETKLLIQNESQYQDWLQRAKSVDWDDLKKVHEMTSQYLQDYPESAHAQYRAAVMAGDYSELLSAEEEKAIKANSVRVLFGLMERLSEFRPYMRHAIRNEYYYHSGRFLDQYLLGCEEIQASSGAGHFSIGVGASEHAFELLKSGRLSEARSFAQKAVHGWQEHAKASPDRAYPYPYFYIQALLISGAKNKAYEEYDRVKKTAAYTLKKPIYDKYEARFRIIEQALNAE